MPVNLDEDPRDADWMKGGHGWPYGDNLEEFYRRLGGTGKPIFVKRARLQPVRRTPWWKDAPKALLDALREDGVLD